MQPKLLNAISMVLLVAAVALAALAISASSRGVRIQGPSALAVLPDGTVWLAVDASLWHLDADGHRIARVDPGIGRIGDLVLHPDGRLVAHARPSATLHFLDPANGRVTDALEPLWPADLADEGGDAINYSFHADGRVAIAAGGDDTVALFDARGELLARTVPGTYKFTNGLWWNGDDLWTTDTNRPALVELDGRTLAVKSRIALTGQTGAWKYLGMAVASHGMASGPAQQAPLATLIRFANGMTRGHATDVFADGSQADYPASLALEPRDIKWRGSELLLVDNASFAIKRYSAARQALADFGDDGVRGELAALHAERDGLRNRYRLFLGLAGVLAVTAIVLYALGEQRKRMGALRADLSRLGTPPLAQRQLIVESLKLMWPPFMLFLALVAWKWALVRLDAASIGGPAVLSPGQVAAVAGLIPVLLVVLAASMVRRAYRAKAADPALEALFNQGALRLLRTDPAFWEMREPGELPEETLQITGASRVRWLVLTNLRLFVFAVNARDRALLAAYPRDEVLRLHLPQPAELTWREKLATRHTLGGLPVRVELRNAPPITGLARSVHTVRRMAEKLGRGTAPARARTVAPARSVAGEPPREGALRHALYSLLAPGLGQWLQGRGGTALMFFLAWIAALLLDAAVAFTRLKHLSAVPVSLMLYGAAGYLLVCLLAALDAWNLRQPAGRDPG